MRLKQQSSRPPTSARCSTKRNTPFSLALAFYCLVLKWGDTFLEQEPNDTAFDYYRRLRPGLWLRLLAAATTKAAAAATAEAGAVTAGALGLLGNSLLPRRRQCRSLGRGRRRPAQPQPPAGSRICQPIAGRDIPLPFPSNLHPYPPPFPKRVINLSAYRHPVLGKGLR